GIGFESFAQSDAGGYHHGFRHLTTISNLPSGVGYLDCPVATPKLRRSFLPSYSSSLFDPRRITTTSPIERRVTVAGTGSRVRGSGPRRCVLRVGLMSPTRTFRRRRRPSFSLVTKGVELRSSRREATGAGSKRCASLRTYRSIAWRG